MLAHKRYHHFSYFYKDIVDYFVEKGEPKGAIKILYNMENGKPTTGCYTISLKYTRKKNFSKSPLNCMNP